MSAHIPKEFIQSLIAQTDIVEIIDQRVPLTSKGKDHKALCPFHDEKTPSFTVNSSRQFYYCFGCEASGNVISFLMEYANLPFTDAVKELADRIGVEIPTKTLNSKADNYSLLPFAEILEKTTKWFQTQLLEHTDARKAIQYLKNRGIDAKSVADFRIGFAPPGWNNITNFFQNDKQKYPQLQKVGLIKQKDNSSQYYDRFRNRLIFPITDQQNKVIGFGGRGIGDEEPKYLNSIETSFFQKKSQLYGLALARKAIGDAGYSIVVEGYIDVVSLSCHQVKNAVATLGTTTSEKHLYRLFQLADAIVFCFDSDRAGREAAWKAMKLSLGQMFEQHQVSFLFLPDGEDPDSFVQKEGKDAFIKEVEKSKPIAEFVFERLQQKNDLSRMDGLAKFTKEALILIESIKNNLLLKELMLDKLSQLSKIPRNKLENKHLNLAKKENKVRPASIKKSPNALTDMAIAISIVLQNPHLIQKADINQELISQLQIPGSNILMTILKTVEQDNQVTTAQIIELFRYDNAYQFIKKLAQHQHLFTDELALSRQLNSILNEFYSIKAKQRLLALKDRAKNEKLSSEEEKELLSLIKSKPKV